MWSKTNPTWTDTSRMAVCHDCRAYPEDGHFTTVPSAFGWVHNKYGPYTFERFNEAVCDKCFLRRRFEGQL